MYVVVSALSIRQNPIASTSRGLGRSDRHRIGIAALTAVASLVVTAAVPLRASGRGRDGAA
jgi:hypothetical protein